MPDARVPPVMVQMNGTAAELLVKLMADLRTDEPMAVLTRSLGLLDAALAARRDGRRLGVLDPATGRFADVVL